MNLYETFMPLLVPLRRWQERRNEGKAKAGKQVTLPRHGVLTIATSLDFLGANCLRTNLLTKKMLGLAAAGDVLEIVTDNLGAAETIPFMLPNYGCVHLATVHDERYRIIYVKKVVA